MALAYISNDTRRFKTVVANRVARIRKTSSPDQWHHVRGIMNPADILSRGCDVDDVPASWFSGPLFLSQHKSSWPQMSTTEYDLSTDIEVSNATTLMTEVQPAVPGTDDQFPDPARELASHYSSFYKLSKAVAWPLRLRHYICWKEMNRGQSVCLSLIKHIVASWCLSRGHPIQVSCLILTTGAMCQSQALFGSCTQW